VTTSVRDFVRMAFAHAGVEVAFEGKDEKEKAIVTKVADPEIHLSKGDIVVEVDKRYFRPTEVDLLLGDATKAKEKLGWTPKYTLHDLAREMVHADIELFRKDVVLKESGFHTLRQFE
ncbi:MAG TPA: GDP-mannose 4,6-dehydratase, partial [Chitinophagaceae bacterium]|nr:GDP-mannose 4,6-dehydratase [Chitinophagaceae bacterium]